MEATGTPLALLKQARVHSLLKGWAGGKRLSSSETAEIRELHPDFQPGAAPASPPVGDELPVVSAPASPVQPDTEATAEQIVRWESLYDTKRRQLFRYIATGREKGRPCPLDHPAQMPAWWGACMKQRVPTKILAAAQRAAGESGTPASDAPGAPPPPPTGELALTEASYDFPAQVERLRGEQRRIQHQLDKARAGAVVDGVLVVSQTDCESLLRQSLSLTAELRKAENDLNAWLVTRGALSDTATIRSENARIAGAIYGAVRRLVRNVRPLLTGKSDAEQDRLWDAKTLECFSALKAAKFTVEIPAETA